MITDGRFCLLCNRYVDDVGQSPMRQDSFAVNSHPGLIFAPPPSALSLFSTQFHRYNTKVEPFWRRVLLPAVAISGGAVALAKALPPLKTVSDEQLNHQRYAFILLHWHIYIYAYFYTKNIS